MKNNLEHLTNGQILKITLYATLLEYMKSERGEFKLNLRIDDRDLLITSHYNPENEYNDDLDIIDSDTGEVIAIQPAEDFFQPIDEEWLDKECETAYSLHY